MATTNHERVGKSLELLRDGLAPFVRREVTAKVRAGAVRMDTIRRFTEDPRLANKPFGDWDAAALLKLMWDTWNDVFRDTLGFIERSLVSELRDWRNKWAHQERFVSDDADRALDSVERLLTAIAAPQADEVARIKRELRRLVFDEQVRGERRTKQEEPRQGQVTHVEQPYVKMRKVRDVILRHIETKTAANPPLGNQAIADIVNAEIPGGRDVRGERCKRAQRGARQASRRRNRAGSAKRRRQPRARRQGARRHSAPHRDEDGGESSAGQSSHRRHRQRGDSRCKDIRGERCKRAQRGARQASRRRNRASSAKRWRQPRARRYGVDSRTCASSRRRGRRDHRKDAHE